MVRNIIVCMAIFASSVSVILAILYAKIGLQNHKKTGGKSPKKRAVDPDVAYSGLPTEDFDAVAYIQENPEICGMINMGVTLDDREIYDCELKLGNP